MSAWLRNLYRGARWTPKTLQTPACEREQILRDRLAQVQFEQIYKEFERIDGQLQIIKERMAALERWRAAEKEMWSEYDLK